MSGPVQSPEQQVADRPEGWWAYPAVYAVTVYVIGFVPNLTWWAGAGVGVVFALLGRVLARHSFHPKTHGETFSWYAQALGVLAGLASGAWLAGLRLVGGPLVAWPWLAFGAAALGLAHLVLLWMAPATARAHARVPAVDVTAGTPAALRAFYQGVLDRSGYGNDVLVTDVKISPSGGVESVHLTPAPLDLTDPKAKPSRVNRDQFTGRLGHIAPELDRALRRRQPPVRLDDQDVHVEHGEGSSEWILHVTVARPLDVTSHFVPSDTPQTWYGAKRCGRYEDDKPLLITFNDEVQGGAHGEFIAATGGGKTGGLNVITARSLESDQGEVWLVGTKKLVKLARPWLEPWLRGKTDRPVIDWVAGEDVKACLRALDSALQYAIECNGKTRGNNARKPARGRGALRVIIDESSDLQERRDTIRCCDGVTRNASQVISQIQKIGRSAPVEVWKVNQDSLFDSFGSAGSQQRRNLGIGIAGKCKADQDAHRVIPGLSRANPMKLRNQSVFVEQLYDEPREVRARFDFIEDDALYALAVRYTPWRYGLDPAITAQMPYYAVRWDRQWHEYLVAEIQAEGLSWPTATTHTGPVPATPGPGPDQPRGEPSDETQDTTREEPTVTNAYRDPTELVDLWDLFLAKPVPDAPGTFENPDPSQMVAGFRRMADWVRNQEAKQHAGPQIPDPLGIVIALLNLPGAPTDWVSTELLAVASQRVDAAADPETVQRAAEQLGRDLSAQDPRLTADKSQKWVDGKRKRGYPVAALRAAAERAARKL